MITKYYSRLNQPCFVTQRQMLLQQQLMAFWGGGRKQPDPNAFDPAQDYYKALDLKKNATQEDIKNMYHKKCYEFHPDKSSSMNQDKFKEINVAYQILRDEQKRREYDQARAELQNPGNQPGQAATQGSEQMQQQFKEMAERYMTWGSEMFVLVLMTKEIRKDFQQRWKEQEKRREERDYQAFAKMNKGRGFDKEWLDNYKKQNVKKELWESLEKTVKHGARQYEEWYRQNKK